MRFLDICISFYPHFLLCSPNCQPRTFLDFRYACWNGTHVLKEGRKNAFLLSVELWGCNMLSARTLAFFGYCQNTHPRTVVLVGLFHRRKLFREMFENRFCWKNLPDVVASVIYSRPIIPDNTFADTTEILL